MLFIRIILGILTGRSEWRDETVRTGFDGGTGHQGQVSTAGRDGRGRFCRRDGTIRGDFLDGTGRYESTVGEIVDGTGPRFHFSDGITISSRRYRQYRPVNKPCEALKKASSLRAAYSLYEYLITVFYFKNMSNAHGLLQV